MANNKAHEELCNEILFGVGSMPEVRAWKRKVGRAIPIHSKADRPILFGIEGEADLQGIISPLGRMLGIEVKTGSGRLSDKQIKWRDMFVRFGGLYVLARDAESVIETVREEINKQNELKAYLTGKGMWGFYFS